MKIYSVYDSKGSYYDKPFIQRNAAEAIRGFELAVNDQKHESMLKLYPADYTLFEIGEWDEQTGSVAMHSAKINLGNGLQMKKEKGPTLAPQMSQ